MTASVIQERETFSTATGGSIALAFSANLTAGSAVHAIATWGTATTTDLSGISGTNTYDNPPINRTADNIDSQSMGQARAVNVAAGAETVTATFVGTPAFRGIWIREIGGVSATPNDGSNARFQQNPGSGADAVTSNTATNANQPVFMSAVSMDVSTGVGPAPGTGTGFTSTVTGWNAGGGAQARSEHQRFTTTTAKAATFTGVVNSNYLTAMVMFDEATGGTVAQGALSGAGAATGIETTQSRASDAMSAAGAATGVLVTAAIDQANLNAAGLAAGSLAPATLNPADLNAAGVAGGSLEGNALVPSVSQGALSAAGTSTGILYTLRSQLNLGAKVDRRELERRKRRAELEAEEYELRMLGTIAVRQILKDHYARPKRTLH